jgi:DNA polymerase-3 subunit alpha
MVVKDVARTLDIPFSRSNEISKLIKESKLSESLGRNPDLKKLYEAGGEEKELIDISLKLEDLIRSAGKHAAGVVIAKGELTDYVPLYKDREDTISSQYDKDALEKAGLVKMDLLGLKNLTIIDKCLKLIKSNTGEDVDIAAISFEDKATFELLQKADTTGIFQLESGGMQNLLRRLKPTVFEDIIAIVALYRPGPLGSGMADDFVKRKRNPNLVRYEHPLLEPILKDTLGVMVYQEQVMLISRVIAGFTMPEADQLRKAMGKKLIKIIDELEQKFLDGAEKNNINRKFASELYNQIRNFGEYGFNKSHSAAYAVVTFQTAYLKARYPVEYMASLLSLSGDKISKLVNNCRQSNIEILPPSINRSYYDFTIQNNNICFGLGAIKGLGEKAIEAIIEARKKHGRFDVLKDFLEKVDLGAVTRGVLESLAKAGAFDEIHSNRAQIVYSIDSLLENAKKIQKDKLSGQGSLFGDTKDSEELDFSLPDVAEWNDNEKLTQEKDVLGLYVSGHPLLKYEKEIKSYSSLSISDISEDHHGLEVSIVGIISEISIKHSQKNGNRYAIALLEDLDATMEILIFARALTKFEEILVAGEPLFITGKIDCEGEDSSKKMIVNAVKYLKEVRREAISAVHIRLDPVGLDDNLLMEIKNTCVKFKGECPVYFHVYDEDLSEDKTVIKAHNTFSINPSEQLSRALSEIVGNDKIRYSIGH